MLTGVLNISFMTTPPCAPQVSAGVMQKAQLVDTSCRYQCEEDTVDRYIEHQLCDKPNGTMLCNYQMWANVETIKSQIER